MIEYICFSNFRMFLEIVPWTISIFLRLFLSFIVLNLPKLISFLSIKYEENDKKPVVYDARMQYGVITLFEWKCRFQNSFNLLLKK